MVRWGSIEQSPHIVTLANFLDQWAFEVVLATVEGGSRPVLLSGEVECAHFGSRALGGGQKLLGLAGVALWLRQIARRHRPDVLYVIDSWTIPAVMAARGWSPQALARVVVYHTFDWLDPSLYLGVRRLHRWYERRMCVQADLCVNVDRSRARLIQSLYHLQSMPLWIPNFPMRQEKLPHRDERLRADLLGPEGRFLVICPSSASPSRLHLELIQAMAKLSAKYRLVTFNGGGEYGRQCWELAQSACLRGRVRFLERCPYEELARYLSCADVGVILNHWKGSSGYYMANSGRLSGFLCGSLPVVASDVPNLQSLVYKWGIGECCDCYDPQAIADAIVRVAEHPPGIEERRSAVRRAFQEELHFERRGELLAQELRRLTLPHPQK